ncbi:phospholipid carrier-dependent glycosyltransferase [Candidatus Microgenomates bacterium]|nr:MAG: phospholipid carrier-dependent glycosyltransferase [Candidatus Microgenomates bacterium]
MQKRISIGKLLTYLSYLALSVMLFGGLMVRLYKIDIPLADWHSWRQADTASVTRTYVERGLNLLEPRYHDVSRVQTGYINLDGWRFVEFPVFNLLHYSIFQTYPQIGFEVAGRLVSVFSALIAAIGLFYIGKKTANVWIGLFSAFFYLFLPYNIFFTRVILPDGLATALAVVSLAFFVKYINTEKWHDLLLSSGLLAVAALTKPYAVFYGFGIFFLAVKKFGFRGIFKNKLLLLSLDIVLIPMFMWRIYINRPPYFWGIAHWEWLFNGDGIRFRPAFWRWLFGERIGKMILGVWGLLPFGIGVMYKKTSLLVHFMLAGAFCYMAVFATANVRHDYYQIFIIPPIALAMGYGAYAVIVSKFTNKLVSIPLLALAIGLSFGLAWYQIRDNYQINDPNIIVAGEAADRLLPKDALVIAPYNGNTAFLYQTKRWGWPVLDDDIDFIISKGADYYVSTSRDNDTNRLMARFEVVEESGSYIILDLHKEKTVL